MTTSHPPVVDAAHPHPFSRFVAILGRGKTKQRHLTLEESRESMAMILRGEALPEQIGAFLMLLRLKEEAPEEIAGFVLGTRDTLSLPTHMPKVDFDWSSYAGKRVQLPWYLLSVMALVGAGFRVFMHGTEGHTPGRTYTSDALKALGIPMATSLAEAAFIAASWTSIPARRSCWTWKTWRCFAAMAARSSGAPTSPVRSGQPMAPRCLMWKPGPPRWTRAMPRMTKRWILHG
ncbi:MAG: hypothetical protein P8X50_17055 [Maritimibacter sp.]